MTVLSRLPGNIAQNESGALNFHARQIKSGLDRFTETAADANVPGVTIDGAPHLFGPIVRFGCDGLLLALGMLGPHPGGKYPTWSEGSSSDHGSFIRQKP